MSYKITCQYPSERERDVPGQYQDLERAKSVIKEKLDYDANLLKVKVIYRLYKDFDDLIETFDPNQMDITSSSSSSGQSSQSSNISRPTPFNTAPRPTGMPRTWIKDEDDKKDKKG